MAFFFFFFGLKWWLDMSRHPKLNADGPKEERRREWKRRMGRNVSADIRGMAPAISPQAYRLSVLVRYSPWPTGDMALNRLHAVKQTTSINSSDSALAFLSLTNPRVCVNVWFKPSLFPSFCLPTGRVKEQRLWPLRHDLFLFIIPSTTFFFFLMRWFFFFPPHSHSFHPTKCHVEAVRARYVQYLLMATAVLCHHRELWE